MSQVGDGPLRGPEGLLFTGDAIRALTPDRLAAIGDFASRLFGVEMRSIGSIQSELGESAVGVPEQLADDREPVPVTRDEIIDFALANGYSRQRASTAYLTLWKARSVEWISREAWEAHYPDSPYPERFSHPLPVIRFLTSHRSQATVDLLSVYDRLKAAEVDATIWYRDRDKKNRQGTINFLAHLVNDRLRPDEPLPTMPD